MRRKNREGIGGRVLARSLLFWICDLCSDDVLRWRWPWLCGLRRYVWEKVIGSGMGNESHGTVLGLRSMVVYLDMTRGGYFLISMHGKPYCHLKSGRDLIVRGGDT